MKYELPKKSDGIGLKIQDHSFALFVHPGFVRTVDASLGALGQRVRAYFGIKHA